MHFVRVCFLIIIGSYSIFTIPVKLIIKKGKIRLILLEIIDSSELLQLLSSFLKMVMVTTITFLPHN